jgi:hypothetical protein
MYEKVAKLLLYFWGMIAVLYIINIIVTNIDNGVWENPLKMISL